MTPAVLSARKAGIEFVMHEYTHDPSHASYGAEAAQKLGVSGERVFKTLVVQLDGGGFGVAVLPVDSRLSMKMMARALGVKGAEMAAAHDVERVTGYVLGGVSPLGQKKRLKLVLDSSAQEFSTVFVSAGRRGLEIELAPADLLRLTGGTLAAIIQGSG
ncbi:Cys-tRNA(Pro) deacylase [Desulfurispirillum indicum]|uniref:Cys-tRNA(Pro)/Cys-tRNA(Cys) deacylase n=1 Tax=Desulfurispirillum indicum (strain ATCC BAA-1389 / DSM 22839 / S5) TaxID=653733 RepID=E6W2X4_DESIS|nr:Cys-tRNA(Pro) deacylase [Desulfurispirillum indicum]ADU66799.1 ybaK/ebsC protein [Desulfurispirillum indicum S5]UCZ56118.1 Cys-tRNA(Pro) deacylase [Desulfurispirillum indicum]